MPTNQHWVKYFGKSYAQLWNELLYLIIDWEGQELGCHRSDLEAHTLCYKYTEDEVTQEWEEQEDQLAHLEEMNEFEDSSWLYTCLGSFNFTGHEVFTTFNFLEELNYRPQSVLDFHSVIGLHSLMLAKLYPELTINYFHPIQRTYEFARDCLFPEFNVKINVFTDLKQLDQYDLVCSYEVFERDPNPTELLDGCLSTIHDYFSTSNCWTRPARTHFEMYTIGKETFPKNKVTRAYNDYVGRNFKRIARGWNSRPLMYMRKS